jgi:hypothetical protein
MPLKEKVRRGPYLVGGALEELPESRLTGSHIPCVRKLRDCYLCSYKRKIEALCLGKRYDRSEERIRTKTFCLQCNRNLCMNSQRNCWAEFHGEKNLL